jgi:spore maturation protein CgeB
MRIVLFYQSILSEWNHGNTHFIRGVVTELLKRGHDVSIVEPEKSENEFNLDLVLDTANLVLVHDWNSPKLVKLLGDYRAKNKNFRILFHDTHHRMATDVKAMLDYDLKNYDGVLAFGQSLANLYRSIGVVDSVWTWHEAADTQVFNPIPHIQKEGDLIWIGNWGNEERADQLRKFLIQPASELGLKTQMLGMRYSQDARTALQEHGIDYREWNNHSITDLFSKFRVTIHIPKKPYSLALPGIPAVQVFEALACGIPLISAPWTDSAKLFSPGRDYLVAHDKTEMRKLLKLVVYDEGLAQELSSHGRKTILARHTCSHRVDELLGIFSKMTSPKTPQVKQQLSSVLTTPGEVKRAI